jgi:hypothetical protein
MEAKGRPDRDLRYNARVRAERPTWTSVGELADRILSIGPEDVERVARKVPELLKLILHKALRGNPDERYQSGGEMRDELCAWLIGQGKRFGRSRAAARMAKQTKSVERLGLHPGALEERAGGGLRLYLLHAAGAGACCSTTSLSTLVLEDIAEILGATRGSRSLPWVHQ